MFKVKKSYMIIMILFVSSLIILSYTPYYKNLIVESSFPKMYPPKYDTLFFNTNSSEFEAILRESQNYDKIFVSSNNNFSSEVGIKWLNDLYTDSTNEINYGVMEVQLINFWGIQTVSYTSEFHHWHMILFVNICGYPVRLFKTPINDIVSFFMSTEWF